MTERRDNHRGTIPGLLLVVLISRKVRNEAEEDNNTDSLLNSAGALSYSKD